jgi:hypothetical protein
MRMATTALAAVLAMLSAPALAVDVVLDFSGDICASPGTQVCGNGSPISQSYGDVSGVLAVAYRSIRASDGQTYEDHLKYWGSSYSNLQGVAWGGTSSNAYIGEIVFTPGANQVVSLNGLDFGDYANRNRTSSAQILDAGTQQVLWSTGTFDPGTTALHLAPGVSSSAGLILRWGPDSYDVGVDNISLSVTAVPEPGSWALLLAGTAVLGLRARRRAA